MTDVPDASGQMPRRSPRLSRRPARSMYRPRIQCLVRGLRRRRLARPPALMVTTLRLVGGSPVSSGVSAKMARMSE